MKKFSVAFLLLIVCFQCLSYSQQPPCMSDFYGLTVESAKLPNIPYLTTDTPYEVMLSYIILDSVCKSSSFKEVKEFLNGLDYGDTLKKIMNYLYRTVDFDAFRYLYTQYSRGNTNNSSIYYMHPRDVINEILYTVSKKTPNYFLDLMLLRADFILHIKIKDTIVRKTPSSGIYPDLSIVTYEILDTIKGKRIPTCKDISIYNPSEEKVIKADNGPNPNTYPCSQFDFRFNKDYFRKEGSRDVILINENNPIHFEKWDFVKIDGEYLVFLNLHPLCSDDYIDYSGLTLTISPLKNCPMFPVVNGILKDKGNDFGLGEEININVIKNFLRNRIQEMINN